MSICCTPSGGLVACERNDLRLYPSVDFDPCCDLALLSPQHCVQPLLHESATQVPDTLLRCVVHLRYALVSPLFILLVLVCCQ